MSKLEKFLAKSKKYNIAGVELEISPLSIQDIHLIVDLEKPEKQAETMKELIRVSLKRAIPEATDDEINQIGMRHLKELMEAIIDVNGLAQDKKKTK